MAMDAFCRKCGGSTTFPAKKGARLDDCRCARIQDNSISSCLGKLTANKMLCPVDQGLTHPKGGPFILVLTTAPAASFKAIQSGWTVPVGRCAP